MINFPYGKQTITQDDIDSVVESLKSELITTGPKTKKFEEAICNYTGAKYAVAVSSATAALHLISMILLKKDDLVLTTPNSFLATSNAIMYAGAKPLFVDICENGNIDLDLCEEELKKNPAIKAIYAVSFSGNMLNQKRLEELKERYNIVILEDNSHTLGASNDNIIAGSCKYSDCSVFSFHPVKNMTTGEGGMLTTNSEEIYKKMILLRNHGIEKKSQIAPWYYEMNEMGYNYRITDFQCALGLTQLKKLDDFISKRREIARYYENSFKNSLVQPLYPFEEGSAYHLFVVRINFRKLKISKKELFDKLFHKMIGVQLHYIPINKQPFYRQLGYGNENTPVMDKYYEEVLSLPIYPLLTKSEQNYIIKSLLECINV